ncbi:MAG: glycosyltransferase family 39 protein, partial [Chloroflexota bacterium]|nr:glycosyltransferase family 39 protein [Chloroflexota bacterium]
MVSEFVRRHWAIALILTAFLALGTAYSMANPLFETPDEGGHYEYVKYLADGRGLPIVYSEFEKNAISPYVVNHPPLYYSLTALATCWIDTDDISTLMWVNPHFAGGMPVSNGNKNMIIHTDQEAFPYHGAVLANRIIRLLSVLFSVVTVLATYLIARILFPEDKLLALGAAAINALNPQFVFMSARVGNDTLVIALSSLVMLGVVQYLANGLPTSGLVLLGLTLGAASLSKVSALGL